MSDFMIYLEEIGAIQSTEWAFNNLSATALNALIDTHMMDYLGSAKRSSVMKSALNALLEIHIEDYLTESTPA